MRTLIINGLSEMGELNHLLNEHFPQVQVVGMAHVAADALVQVDELAPELVLLGMDLPNELVTQLLVKMNKHHFALIYMGNHTQPPTWPILTVAAQCLARPLELDHLATALFKAWEKKLYQYAYQQMIDLTSFVKQSHKKEERLVLPTSNGIRLAYPKEVLYCAGTGSYTQFFLVNGHEPLVSQGMYCYADQLQEDGFIKANHNTLVNIQHISGLVCKDGVHELILLDGKATVHVSRSKVAMVREVLGGKKKGKR